MKAFKLAKWALAFFTLTLVVMKLTWGSENRDDISGVIEEVVDSHTIQDVIVNSAVTDRVHYPATRVVGTGTQVCIKKVTRSHDGVTGSRTDCHCSGTMMNYTDIHGKRNAMSCANQSGSCPVNDGYVTIPKHGNASCVFGHTPKVNCNINGKVNCSFDLSCPKEGDTISLARGVNDNSLRCKDGDWNTCTLNIRYTPPNSTREKTQDVVLSMDAAGSSRYKVGKSIPVYYSRKDRQIYLYDRNTRTMAGFLVKSLLLVTLGFSMNAASYYFSKSLCLLRIGVGIADKLDDKLGFDIL
jgi:hypothetical protein